MHEWLGKKKKQKPRFHEAIQITSKEEKTILKEVGFLGKKTQKQELRPATLEDINDEDIRPQIVSSTADTNIKRPKVDVLTDASIQ